MDSGWNFRNAYNEAKKIKLAQDDFCAKAESGDWHGVDEFPESLQWEALVDVLRGRVKVCLINDARDAVLNFCSSLQLAVHCYEAVDLDAIVRVC